MEEQWAAIGEAPGYEVSTCGRVRRGAFEVASWPNKRGYVCVNLEVHGRPAVRYVHRLVLSAFDGPGTGLEANHLDGCKRNARVDNLEWTTPAENVRHAWATGLMPRTRARRLTCRFGHPRQQLYTQRDRSGTVRKYVRCARCRRAAYCRARAHALWQRLPFDDPA